MAYTTASARVGVPAERAAESWRNPKLFAEWISGVAVRPLGRHRTRWAISILGRQLTFDAVRLPTSDPRRVAWRSVRGIAHCGVIDFTDRLDPRTGATVTTATLRMAWKPESVAHRVATALGVPQRRIRVALDQFRFATERLAGPASSRRGLVRGHRTTPPPIISPGDAPMGTPGTPFGPMFPYTAPGERG